MKAKKLQALTSSICLFDGLINGRGRGGGGLISRRTYIRNNIFVGRWMGLYPGRLKTGGGGGGFKAGFYGISTFGTISKGCHKFSEKFPWKLTSSI